MKLLNLFVAKAIFCSFSPCQHEEIKTGLALYLDQNSTFVVKNELIACAASQAVNDIDYERLPVSVFFYPITGAYDFKYFECNDVNVDITDYSKFIEKVLISEPVFNGYLRRFKNKTIEQDVWGIVTYKVDKSLHICRAIRIKHYTKPTQFDPNLVTIVDSLTFPRFEWNDGNVAENAIYFQVVSDTLNNLISGTYTYEKFFKFYDLSNVVLNIRDINPFPSLQANTKYNFLVMGVTQDNWVNLIAATSFNTY